MTAAKAGPIPLVVKNTGSPILFSFTQRIAYRAPSRSRAERQTFSSSTFASSSEASCTLISLSAARRAVGRLELRHLLRELVGHEPQVLAIEFRRDGRRDGLARIREPFVDGGQDVLGVARLDQHAGDAAGAGEVARVALAVVRGVEDDFGGRERRVRAQAAHELVTVHRRHQHVRDDERRPLRPHDLERVGAVRGLERLVSPILEQRDHQLAVRRVVVDDKNLGHPSLRRRSFRMSAAPARGREAAPRSPRRTSRA